MTNSKTNPLGYNVSTLDVFNLDIAYRCEHVATVAEAHEVGRTFGHKYTITRCTVPAGIGCEDSSYGFAP